MMDYVEKDIYIAWTFTPEGRPAMMGIFEDMDEAKACCLIRGDCVQPAKLNKVFDRAGSLVDEFGEVWVYKGKEGEEENANSGDESNTGREDKDN